MAGGPEPILLSILIVIVGAKLGGEAAERVKQPAVLGELLVGVLLGASLLGGFIGLPDFGMEQDFHHEEDLLHEAQKDHEKAVAAVAAARESGANQTTINELEANAVQAQSKLEAAERDYARFADTHSSELGAIEILSILATLGVILLLFEVGLESDVKELTKVGASSLLVAFIGVVVSFAFGYLFSMFLTDLWSPWQTANEKIGNNLLHVFVGATLTATSVGITARVLGDMGRLGTNETRIILGAAVIDDIAGLIILAIVAALVAAAASGNPVDTMSLLIIAANAIGFLIVSLLVGLKFIPRAYDALVEKMQVKGFPVAIAISFALFMAYLATLFNLADIVGAFAGGLILAQTKHAHKIFEEMRPIAAIFVSFFFVTLGMRVDLTQMEGNTMMVIVIGITLTIVAMAAKLACGWGVLKDAKASKLVVGVGMSPRGEVGLIFAALGLATGLIVNWQYTAVIIVVMLTTFITPIWLKRLQDRFIGGGDVDPKAQELSQIYDS